MVAAVRSHHVFIHCELDLSPELAVLLRAHGQPEEEEGGGKKIPERKNRNIKLKKKGKVKAAAVVKD